MRISDVADERDRSVANLMRDLFDLFGSSRGYGDTEAFACKSESDCATNTSAAASYQCSFDFGYHGFGNGLVSGEFWFAFLEECLDAFVTVVRFETSQLRFSLVA